MSSSPLSQIGVDVGVVAAEYAANSGISSGRGERPRISLLPPASVTPTPSPTAPGYQHNMSGVRNSRIALMPVQPDQYCNRTAVEMANLQERRPSRRYASVNRPRFNCSPKRNLVVIVYHPLIRVLSRSTWCSCNNRLG